MPRIDAEEIEIAVTAGLDLSSQVANGRPVETSCDEDSVAGGDELVAREMRAGEQFVVQPRDRAGVGVGERADLDGLGRSRLTADKGVEFKEYRSDVTTMSSPLGEFDRIDMTRVHRELELFESPAETFGRSGQ
jgi:hypothetical protein